MDTITTQQKKETQKCILPYYNTFQRERIIFNTNLIPRINIFNFLLPSKLANIGKNTIFAPVDTAKRMDIFQF